MKTVAIIQARMGSTRLPGKVLTDVAGKPMLTRVVERLRRAKTLDEIVIATSIDAADDPLADFCRGQQLCFVRGSQDDVLDRYRLAAERHLADTIVRITADCPLIDPGVTDHVTAEFHRRGAHVDYACNFLPNRTFPRGLETEVFSRAALETAWRQATDDGSREHVTLYIYRNPQLFRLYAAANERDDSDKRWTVDTPLDLRLIRTIYAHFGNDHFSWQDVLRAHDEHPDWARINQHVQQKVA